MIAKREISANAHEIRESLWQFPFAGNLGLSPSILSYHSFAGKNCQKKSLKINILGFKVIQGHRC